MPLNARLRAAGFDLVLDQVAPDGPPSSLASRPTPRATPSGSPRAPPSAKGSPGEPPRVFHVTSRRPRSCRR